MLTRSREGAILTNANDVEREGVQNFMLDYRVYVHCKYLKTTIARTDPPKPPIGNNISSVHTQPSDNIGHDGSLEYATGRNCRRRKQDLRMNCCVDDAKRPATDGVQCNVPARTRYRV